MSASKNKKMIDPIQLSNDTNNFFADRGISQWIICIVENTADDQVKCGLLGSETSPGIRHLLNLFQHQVQCAGGNLKQQLIIKKPQQ